jgi:hypothetical protein
MAMTMMSTKTHAVEDYLTSSTLPFVARNSNISPKTRRVFDTFAAVAGAQSMMTDYEGGMLRVLPMRVHLASDALIGVGLLALAVLSPNQPKADRWALAGLGMFSLVSALMTNPKTTDELHRVRR